MPTSFSGCGPEMIEFFDAWTKEMRAAMAAGLIHGLTFRGETVKSIPIFDIKTGETKHVCAPTGHIILEFAS